MALRSDTASLAASFAIAWHPFASNEFSNVISEMLPLVFFMAQLIDMTLLDAHRYADPALRVAVVGTLFGTVLQHLCSLVAHAGHRMSANLSHTIWFLDYSGIVLNFVWNSPALCFVLAPQSRWTAPFWFAANVASTLLLLSGAAYLVRTRGAPTAGSDPEGTGTGFFTVMSSSPSALLVCAMMLPNLGLTAIAPFATPRLGDAPCLPATPALATLRAWLLWGESAEGTDGWLLDSNGESARWAVSGVLPLLALSLMIKTLHVPERFVVRTPGFFDFSPAHSHVLWHLGVWASQLLYHRYYTLALTSCTGMW